MGKYDSSFTGPEFYVKPPLDTESRQEKVNEKEHSEIHEADGEEFEYKVTAP